MATKQQIDKALKKDDAFAARIKLSATERKPRFTSNGLVRFGEDSEFPEEEQEAFDKLLTPDSITN